MPPPTREQVNALIERLKDATSTGGLWVLMPEVVQVLTALQAENDRLRAQASPAWVAWDDNGEKVGYWWWNIGHQVIATTVLWSEDRAAYYVEDSILKNPLCRDRGGLWMRAVVPALSESAADRQRREDEEAVEAGMAMWRKSSATTVPDAIRAALAHARKEATP